MGDVFPGLGPLLQKHASPELHWDEEYDVALEIKEVSADGTFTGYGSTFGNVDSDRDIIEPGAFSKSLKRKNPKDIKLLWQHNPQEPIGVWEELMEDSRGLKVKGRLLINQNVPLADKAYALMKAGALGAMSIGFAIPKNGYEIDEGKQVRRIKEADLWECSIVTFPANPKAKIQRVKTAVPFQDLPVADRGRAWDAEAATKRLQQWAGGATSTEGMDWDKYRKGFLWYNSDEPHTLDSYKMPVADVISGELTVIPRGVFAAAGTLLVTRDGTEGQEGRVPEGEVPRLKSHLERYYSKLDLGSPFAIVDMGDTIKSYGTAILTACDGPVSFKRALTELGFSKKQAEDYSAQYDPQADSEGTEEVDAKLDEIAATLKSITQPN